MRLLIHRRVEIRVEVWVVFGFGELFVVGLVLRCFVVVRVFQWLECLRVEFLNLIYDVAREEIVKLNLVITGGVVEVVALIIVLLVIVIEVVVSIVVVAIVIIVVVIVVIVVVTILIVIVLIIVSIVVEIGLLNRCVVEIAVLVVIIVEV